MSADGSSPVIGPLTRAPVPVLNAFNRPTNGTDYDVGDIIANSTSAGSVTPLHWTSYWGRGTIRRVKIRKSNQVVMSVAPTLRLYLFAGAVVPGAGDNAAFAAPLAALIDVVDVDLTLSGSDDAVGIAACDIPYEAAEIYGLLQVIDAFTPVSGETFTVDLIEYPG